MSSGSHFKVRGKKRCLKGPAVYIRGWKVPNAGTIRCSSTGGAGLLRRGLIQVLWSQLPHRSSYDSSGTGNPRFAYPYFGKMAELSLSVVHPYPKRRNLCGSENTNWRLPPVSVTTYTIGSSRAPGSCRAAVITYNSHIVGTGMHAGSLNSYSPRYS